MPHSSDYNDVDLPMAILPALDLLRNVTSRTVAGIGEFEGFCVLDRWRSDDLEAMLPPGLSLVDESAPAKTVARFETERAGEAADESAKASEQERTHHVVHIFARQRNVRPGFVPFGGANYLEITQLIPNVTHSETGVFRNTRFSYMPNLMLDWLPAVIVGKNLYGFNKQLASICADGDSFSIRSSGGTMSAWFERAGPPGRLSSHESIRAIQDMLNDPLIGLKEDGSFVYSFPRFGLKGATCQPVKGIVNLNRPFVSPARSLELQPLTEQDQRYPWGFRLISRWSLTSPFSLPFDQSHASSNNLRRVAAEYTDAFLGGVPFRRR